MNKLLLIAALGVAGTSPLARKDAVEAIVLGVAQDGGVPHMGCRQPLCVRARKDPRLARRVASLGIVDRAAGKRFVIDATPDFAAQVDRLGGLPDAILLTHAHIGHYLGLAQLGREVLSAREVPIYCTPAMAHFLSGNGPWSRLVERRNIVLREVSPGSEVVLTDRLRATPIRVPHRDEDSDTVAWQITGPRRRPEDFAADRRALLFLDGTFFDSEEIPGRSIADVPHPLVPETVARLEPRLRARVLFIHLNHTNRLLWDAAARRDLERRGFSVAREGSRFPL
jgi:pyrroloquinoline quinone biosynthesis protein B